MISIGTILSFKKVKAFGLQGEFEVDFSKMKGKKVVLYAYPKDMTPGCTLQARNLAQFYDELQNAGIEVIGVSADSLSKHQKFSEKYTLPFALISDEEKEFLDYLGVWQLKKMYGKEYYGTIRTSFLFDENLKLVSIIEKPKVKEHAQEILERYQEVKHKQ